MNLMAIDWGTHGHMGVNKMFMNTCWSENWARISPSLMIEKYAKMLIKFLRI